MTIARTAAAGEASLLPEVLAFSSSLSLDRALLREDLIGSLAHLSMLAHQGLVPSADAQTLHKALVAMWEEALAGKLELPDDEEDVHMAVESELGRRAG